MIELRALRSGYDGHEVLHGLDLTIPRGAVTVLVGPNGCGKSTLLKTLMGALRPTGGTLLIDGKDTFSYPPNTLAQKVAYLPQGRNTPDITAGRMVLHGRFPYLSYPRRYSPQDRQIAQKAMERMGVAQLAHVPMSQLSGGTRQKVYIAMALAQDTPAILMDEPLAYLDISHQLSLAETGKALAAEGRAVLMVLHDLPLALRLADYIAVLEDGTLAGYGTPEEIFGQKRLDAVFHVTLRRFQTDSGWQYYIAP